MNLDRVFFVKACSVLQILGLICLMAVKLASFHGAWPGVLIGGLASIAKYFALRNRERELHHSVTAVAGGLLVLWVLTSA